MIIAVDFDGTCVTHAYPDIGEEIPGAIETLQWMVQEGHELILWTCRDGEELEDAISWFKQNEIELAAANEMPSGYTFPRSPKINADVYIDDRNLGMGTVVWDKIKEEVQKRYLYEETLWQLRLRHKILQDEHGKNNGIFCQDLFDKSAELCMSLTLSSMRREGYDMDVLNELSPKDRIEAVLRYLIITKTIMRNN